MASCSACILRLDAMQHFVLIPYATSSQFHTSLRDDLICSFLRCKKLIYFVFFFRFNNIATPTPTAATAAAIAIGKT